MSKVLITGGGGFIGRNLAKCLREYNYEVIAPTHTELDITNLARCMEFMNNNKVDVIIHTAFKGSNHSNLNQYEDFVDNIKMMDTLTWLDNYQPIIIIGSGAEFDRRFPIDRVKEEDVFQSWPVDLYGLSKNIISRRLLNTNFDYREIENPFVLRLFGCFGSDEADFRFIKSSILRLKKGLPIEINKNKEMDYFFVDDVATVIDTLLCRYSESYKHVNFDSFRHMNLVYQREFDKKYKLSDIAEIICDTMNVPRNIVIKEENDHPYTGDGWRLKGENLNLIGLESGIENMVEELS